MCCAVFHVVHSSTLTPSLFSIILRSTFPGPRLIVGFPLSKRQEAIKQNDRFVVALTVTEYEAAFARLLLVDRLPSGLEIDNPDLFEGGSTEALSFLKKTVEPAHTEYCDDRFVAAFVRDGHDKASFSVAYIVRAVTPGHYVSPPATIEDMYRPERFGRTAYGVIEIAAAK
jgi:alpha-2-macroglobulin